jgi:predicted metal-dependent hydrolase
MLLLGGLTLGAGALTAVAAAGESKKEKYPHIEAAIRELHEAHRCMKDAPHDFGGHRVEALELINRTIRQLELCLKY